MKLCCCPCVTCWHTRDLLQEDVLYALSEGDAIQDLDLSPPAQAKLSREGKSKMVYLLQPDGSSTALLSYLRSVYSTPGQPQTQWSNFVERVKGLAAARGENVPKLVCEVSESGQAFVSGLELAGKGRGPHEFPSLTCCHSKCLRSVLYTGCLCLPGCT